MTFTTQNLSDVTILHGTGRLTFLHAEGFRKAACQTRCCGTLVLDLAEATSVDAAGLGALVSVRNWCKEHGTALKLMNIKPTLLKLLQLTRLDSVFETCSGREMIDLLCRSIRDAEQESIKEIQMGDETCCPTSPL